jgi:hypothetical protein
MGPPLCGPLLHGLHLREPKAELARHSLVQICSSYVALLMVPYIGPAALLALRQDGTYQQLYDKWFTNEQVN